MVFTEEKRQCEKNMKKKTREGAKSTGCSARKGPKRLNGSVRTPKQPCTDIAKMSGCIYFFRLQNWRKKKRGREDVELRVLLSTHLGATLVASRTTRRRAEVSVSLLAGGRRHPFSH